MTDRQTDTTGPLTRLVDRSLPSRADSGVGAPNLTPDDDLSGKRILLVSAPFGPFARVFADELRRRGATVTRMLFSAGDALWWGTLRDTCAFTGSADAWAEAVVDQTSKFTDVLVFGESGPYNSAVLSRIAGIKARVWVLENGYFRPNWVTLERNGVNGNSGLPRSRAAFDNAGITIEEAAPVGLILPFHVLNISFHHLAHIPGKWFFRNFKFPYAHSFSEQGWSHAWSFVQRKILRINRNRFRPELEQRPYFVACLQRDGDHQLVAYSDYKTNEQFLEQVIGSFASHAPRNTYLLIKNHPLDCGIGHLRRVAARIAAHHDVTRRVVFIDEANFNSLSKASLGIVVNNSTAGLTAMGQSIPVKVLGQSIFNVEGLADQKPLDAFWQTPVPPDLALFERFRAFVIAHTQVAGSFHAPRHIRPTARRLADVMIYGRSAALQSPSTATEPLALEAEVRARAG